MALSGTTPRTNLVAQTDSSPAEELANEISKLAVKAGVAAHLQRQENDQLRLKLLESQTYVAELEIEVANLYHRIRELELELGEGEDLVEEAESAPYTPKKGGLNLNPDFQKYRKDKP